MNSFWKFLTTFSIAFLLETLATTYLISCVQSMERQFQITSKLSGALIASSDIGYVMAVVGLAYLGSKGNRVAWIGAGCLLVSISSLLIALPSFIFPVDSGSRLSPTANDSLKDFQLPPQIITYDEVDSLSKLQTHPHVGCSFKEWLRNRGYLIISNLNTQTFVHDCDAKPDIDITKVVSAKLLPTLETETYEKFARSFINSLNNARLDGRSEGRLKHRLYELAKLPAYCSRLVNYMRLYVNDLNCVRMTTNMSAFAIVLVGIMLMGVGHSVPWTLGMPLIDDNVKKRNAPLYFAGVSFVRILGPMLGFFIGGFCNRLYHDFSLDPSLADSDSNWIGAWWLGFILIAVLLPVPSIILLLLKGVDQQSNGAGQTRQTVSTIDKAANSNTSRLYAYLSKELKTFFTSIIHVFKSPIYTLSLMGRLLEFLCFKGFFVFQAKYMENNFNFPFYKGNISLGIFDVVMFALGTLLGSALLRGLRLEGRRAAGFVAICKLICVVISFLQMLPTCELPKKSLGAMARLNNLNFENQCNQHCHCTNSMLFPVCSNAGSVYYSPCHAGCQAVHTEGKNFTSCLCVDSGSSVSADNCAINCLKPMIAYLTLVSLGSIVSGASTVPSVLMVLRTVPLHLKAVALGFSGFLIGLISTFPSPIMFGHVIDNSCLIWRDSCGGAGACSIYDTDTLRNNYMLLHASLRLASLFFDVLVVFWAKNLILLAELEIEPGPMVTAVEMAKLPIRRRATIAPTPARRVSDVLEAEYLALRNDGRGRSASIFL